MIGLTPDSPFALRNKLKVFNIAVFAILLISCFYLFVALLNDYHLSTAVTVYSVLSCLIILYLVSRKRYLFAFHFGLWYGLIFLSAFSFIFGSVTNSHYYFLFLPIACNILFDNPRTVSIYFVTSVVVMLFSVYLMDHVEPYYKVEDTERWLGYPNVPFVMLLIFLSVRMFKNENRKYAAKIEDQRTILEIKNKEITDSINYARRIQSALLAPATLMNKNLPEHFVLYKPKDIVSGDFYWAAESIGSKTVSSTHSEDDFKGEHSFWLCVGDCTGHGVPGAFMSLMNIAILRELIGEQNVQSPEQVLNKQRERIIAALNPTGAAEKGKDGMDCVIAKFDFVKQKMYFSCANNPLWIVRDGQLTEFRPDKQPVGIHEGEITSFTLHEWNIQKGDCIYLFTDGFADQFGGQRGKKFKYAQLKTTLLACHQLSATAQSEELEKTFNEWKGNLEQVDDVLIIGVKI